jgi:hypothetical protein
VAGDAGKPVVERTKADEFRMILRRPDDQA